jgi:hypothetical protein
VYRLRERSRGLPEPAPGDDGQPASRATIPTEPAWTDRGEAAGRAGAGERSGAGASAPGARGEAVRARGDTAGAFMEPPAHAPAAPAPAPAVRPVPAPAPAPAPAAPDQGAALHLLAILQREGRLVDFIEEELTGFSDAEIGAAARTVHAGCKKAVSTYFQLEPIYREPEGAPITVAAGFDPGAVRLTGNVVGQPPFKGALRHHGWKCREVKLPSRPGGQDANILAPAEVEL